MTDEASEETEDGDGDGEGPVPVDDHRHGPGAGQVVGDQEDEDQEEPDHREQGGQPGDGLTQRGRSPRLVLRRLSLPSRRRWRRGFPDLWKHKS